MVSTRDSNSLGLGSNPGEATMTKQELLSRISAIRSQLDDLVNDVANNKMFNEQEWIDFEDYLNDISNLDYNEL